MTESGFRDMHAHFIYGVDDGASSLEEMKAMIDVAHENGVTDLYATSHFTPGIRHFPETHYQEHFSVTITIELPTPYEKDEKVAVLVGLVEGDAVTWKIFEGTGLEDGKVQLTLDAETALKLAAGPALFAVCSK